MTFQQGRVTYVLAAVTFVAFLALDIGGLLDRVAYAAGFIPARLDGLTVPAEVALPIVPTWLTPLTATLVHAGWMHIGFNLLILFFCGRQVEQVLGGGPVLALYLIGAYAAAAAQWALDPGSVVPMVGASGAISAVMGTYSLLYTQRSVRAFGPFSANMMRVIWLAAGWIALQALIGFATHVDSEGLGAIAVGAHVGGFIAGLLLTRPLLRWRFRPVPGRTR